ncbi:hypothetical protein [Sulfobacillus harzensis]|uniref:Fibronectin type-III domain-containing protein n=1 Tax=Sulfobacillus harzensis TaxID=2729629 RepID=A0A7Y0L3V9_9FIRM|nr:hypothetical protein [Sulfobacillus harzensis]NMP22211.1 hypothetical protein [Sulfobacillus harzensis]
MAADNLGPAAVSTTTKYNAPNPAAGHGPSLLLLGAAGLGALVLMRRSSAASTASTSTTTTSTGSGSYSPSLGVPGAPVELQQVGGTATSVTVECAAVTGATQYNWYQYGTNLLLATSPSNVAVIDGLQTNTGYEVYCTAVNINGQQSPPSQPLLVTTGAGSPVVYVNNYGGSGTGSSQTTQPAPSTTTPTQPTLPTGQTLAMAANPASPTTSESTTVTASSTALATYLSQVTSTGNSAPSVSWQWIIRSPSGSVAVNQTLTNTTAQSQETFTPNSAGQWAVTVTCSVGGRTVGQGSIGVTAAVPYTPPANPTNPNDYPSVQPNQPFTPTNLQNPIYKLPSGVVHIGAEVGSQARAQTIARANAVGEGVSLPGLSAAEAGKVVSIVKQHGNAVSGVLPNGVVQLSSTASNAEKVSLLASGAPVSIPGRSAAYVAYLQQLAKEGKLKGVTASGTAIT